MEGPRLSRPTGILIGIGLVLVGLLSGILFMLYVGDVRPASQVAPEAAEQVRLGNQDTIRPVWAPDSSASLGLVEPTTLNRLFKGVSSRVTPAVVYIQVEVPASEMLPREWFHNFDDEEMQDRFPAPRQSVGSGVIISDEGYIITNNHVIDSASRIQVTLNDKRQYDAEVIGTDHSTDLAVLRLTNRRVADLPVIDFGDSDSVRVGEWVLAVGNPFRLTSTVTAGIVSALGRQVNIIEDRFGIEDFIQTDAAINPGNSGGALVNLQGELIGISTAIATESGSYEGYGFAVPVNLMSRVAQDLIAYGEVQRGYLGVSIQEVSAQDARRLGLDQVSGVFLAEITRNGAAARAGLRAGDVVLAIDGTPIHAPNELQRIVARHRPGDLLSVEVWRRGARQQFPVELFGRDDPSYQAWFSELQEEDEPAPEPAPEASEEESLEAAGWGIGLRPLTDREHDAFEVTEGAYVAYIKNGSPGAQAGLPRDVVLLEVGGTAVLTPEAAVQQFEEAADAQQESVLVRVQRRDGLSAFYELEVPGS